MVAVVLVHLLVLLLVYPDVLVVGVENLDVAHAPAQAGEVADEAVVELVEPAHQFLIIAHQLQLQDVVHGE